MSSISTGVDFINIVADAFGAPVVGVKTQRSNMTVNKEHIAFAAVAEVIVISPGGTVKKGIYRISPGICGPGRGPGTASVGDGKSFGRLSHPVAFAPCPEARCAFVTDAAQCRIVTVRE